jgi:hypothetical protein
MDLQPFRAYPPGRRPSYTPPVLNRLFTSIAIVSLLAAVAVAILWWRAEHGHADTFHLGASSPTQVRFEPLPGGRLAIHRAERTDDGVQSRTDFVPMRSVMGGCFVVPALWAAIRLRRRLRPRPPGSQLPALRST